MTPELTSFDEWRPLEAVKSYKELTSVSLLVSEGKFVVQMEDSALEG